MKTTTSTIKQTALRLLAGLIFFLLLAPMAAGEEVSTPDSNWKDYLNGVDKLANDNGGNGTSWDDAILIASAEELAYFAQQVNEGDAITYRSGSGTAQIEPGGKDQDAGGFLGYYFALSANIDLKEHYWTPIGTEDNLFKGNFDGKGHCVSGLMVNVNENNNNNAYAGLFGNAPYATFKNLGVRLAQAGVRIEAKNGKVYAGGLAAVTNSVYNCYVEGPGTIKAIITEENSDPGRSYYVYAGGIAGELNSNARAIHCYSTVDVKAEGPSFKNYAGGIAGQIGNSSLTSNTYATGTVEAVGATFNYAGGIVGYVGGSSSGKFEYNLALNDSVKGSNSNRMVGDNESKVTFSSNYASPDMLVSGTVVSDDVKNGSSKDLTYINLNDTLNKIWKNGWTFPEDGNRNLPQLQLITGDEDNPSYSEWPTTSPQPIVDPVAYLPHGIAGTGKGTSWSDLILIADEAELAYLAKQVNAGNSLVVGKKTIANKGEHEGFKGIYFALAADIDLKEHYWTPIGTTNKPFNGNFDGRGYCVSGLKVNVDKNSVYTYAGLFGKAFEGTIQNLGVHLAEEGVRIIDTNNMEGLSCAGGIAGQAQNVHNCYVVGKGSIEINGGSSGYAGGIVGYLTSNGLLTNCYATVDITIENSVERYAGGIVGFCNYNSTISCTYATGDVETGTGNSKFYAGGICGYLGSTSTIQNNLALNGRITGGNDSEGNSFSNRIVGEKFPTASLTTNYASPEIVVNGKTSPDNQVDNENGANTWLSSFEADLKKEPAGDANGWATSWTFTSGYLPQLMKKTADGKYEAWTSKQPQLNANLYLPPSPKLHIVSPTGGTLKVTDKDGNELPNGSYISPGTLLKLAYTEDANYYFSGYLSGSNKDNLSIYGDNSITMPDADLYLSATFTVYPKLHIVSPTGGTLKVTDNDGNELSNGNYIRPGTVLTLVYTEADNYRFSGYLSGSNEGSLSIYGDNSITMPNADLYLSATFTLYPKLHIVSPTGGTLKVTDKDGNELPNGSYISPGTLLKLAYTEDANYYFSGYLSGSNEGSLSIYGDNSIMMPDADLYLSANFTLSPKLHIVSSTGGTLKVTGNDGKELSNGSYILPGTVLTLVNTEADNYRFSGYLSGSDKDNLSIYGDNSIMMPDADLYLSATFTYQEPTPPYVPPVPVFYSVYLPQVEGATTDPAPGEYKVESWDNFRFTLKIDSAYNESQPVVTTSRGETLQPRSIDGSYLVKYVRSDVEVFIDGIFKNTPPVANEAISADVLAPQIWAEGSMLCIRMAEALPSAPVRIFTPDGRQHASFASTPGLIRRQLSTGIYIVRVGETVCKVLIR